AGVDAARSFGTGCFRDHRTHDLRGMDEDELKSVQHWKQFFKQSDKYPFVGKVIHPPIDPKSPIPKSCKPPPQAQDEQQNNNNNPHVTSAQQQATQGAANKRSDL
ncbi:hypothetical protein FRC17_004680, partial [Serendipita sp. 399]